MNYVGRNETQMLLVENAQNNSSNTFRNESWQKLYGRNYMSGTDCVNLGRKLYDVSMNGLKSCPYKEYIPTFLKGTGSGLATIVVGYRKLGLYYEANTLQRVIENVFTN